MKRANISIKFSNFCKVNRNAPLIAKLDVLDICVSSAITYAGETWGNSAKEADTCYRSGLKTALSIRQSTNNEIIYIETGKFPLHCRIKKSQLKFWLYINEYVSEFPDAALSKVLRIGLESNISYLKYYHKLVTEFRDPVTCEEILRNTSLELWKDKIIQASADPDSKLGTY